MSGWKRSSFCGNSTCVEVLRTPGYVQIRKAGEQPAVTLTGAEWAAFVAGVKANEFDWPVPR